MGFEWVKTSKKLPPTHTIILYVDRWDNFHYGVLCSELSKRGHKNKYWCHIHNRTYHKKDIDLWCLVDEMGAMKLLYPARFKESEFQTLSDNIGKIKMQIEREILADAKERDYEQMPGVIVRNCLHRYNCDILKISRSMNRSE